MKVLVTGGAGFIGSHITEQLLDEGHRVVVVDNLATGRRENLHPNIVFYEADITDRRLHDVFERERPDCVVHEAAQVSVQRSVRDPVEDARINILGTVNLLDCCRACDVRKFVFASSCAIYGNTSVLQIAETEAAQPQSPYGAAKLTSERYIQLYHQLYGIQYCVLRYSNVYGPRQTLGGEGAVVPSFVHQLLCRQAPIIYGDGTQSRDFVYVSDVATANVRAVTTEVSGNFNISSGASTRICDLYKMVERATGTDFIPVFMEERAGEIKHSCLNNRRARTLLGWRPVYSLENGLSETVAAYRSVMDADCREKP